MGTEESVETSEQEEINPWADMLTSPCLRSVLSPIFSDHETQDVMRASAD